MFAELGEMIAPMYGYLVTTLVAVVLVVILIAILTSIPLPGKTTMRIFSLFIGLSTTNCISLGAAFQKLLLVLYFIVSRGELTKIYVITFFILCILSLIVQPKGAKVILEVCYAVFIFGGLLLYEYLLTYLRDIISNWYVILITVLLGVLLSLTAVWYFLREICLISEHRVPRIEEMYENPEKKN